MVDVRTLKDHRQKIAAVTHYIFKNLGGDLSLERLAALANYSPFHFQKVFKQEVGESPKQYIIRLRLDTAAHYLIIHEGRSVQEISIDCGFSSSSVFSRAFRSYHGISAEQLRARYKTGDLLLKKSPSRFEFELPELPGINERESLPIVVKRMVALSGICVSTTFEQPQIERALREVLQLAEAHDLLQQGARVLGVIGPHHNIYRAFVSVNPVLIIPHSLIREEIKGGKYATFKVRGAPKDAMNRLATDFFMNWLPASGYRIADIYGFEVLGSSPLERPYDQLEREVYIPIEPA